MRIDSTIVGLLVGLVAVWVIASVLTWLNAGLASMAILVTTVVLVAALFIGVAVGLGVRERARTTYW